MIPIVNASDLRKFSFCPRALYLERVLNIKPTPSPERERGTLAHSLRKELSLAQGKIIQRISSADELAAELRTELEKIILDAPKIYYSEELKEIDILKTTEKIKLEILNEINFMKENLSAMIEKFGLERSLKKITPWRLEFSLRSEKLGLSGRIDKVFLDDNNKYVPVEIKTGIPARFVWEGDRFQVGTYALLLEERFETTVPHAFIEYTRIQEKRPILISEKLRREVICARDKIREIIEDKNLPEICPHGQGKKCEACSFYDSCYEL